jgi:hypothetical protein
MVLMPFSTIFQLYCGSQFLLSVETVVPGENNLQSYVIKFVSDFRQVGGFLLVLQFPPPIKTDCHNITEILLKMALKP